jgi:hypothetical protein
MLDRSCLFRGVLLASLVWTTAALAAEEAVVRSRDQMTPDEMMAAWKKAATPNENHAFLATMAGSFTASVKHWIRPDQPPSETTGTSVQEMILGGRFLKQTYRGEFRGQPIEGFGLTGYDNLRRRYTSIWLDSSGTETLVTHGVRGSSGRVIQANGTFDDTMTGKRGKVRTVTESVDDRTIRYEMYKTREGQEHKILEVVYVRNP